MKKINIKIFDSKDYKQGQQDFRDKRIKNKGVGFSWYKTTIPTKKWNEYYSKIPGYTFLDGNTKEVSMGFLSVSAPAGCLEVTNMEELRKIDLHRRAIRAYPLVFDDVK